MTRKTKSKRINLRSPSETPSEKVYRQALLTTEDHGKLPTLAERINRAHPGMKIDKVADVLHFCIEAGEKALELQGA